MKRIISIIYIVLLLFSFAACEDSKLISSENDEVVQIENTEEVKYKSAMELYNAGNYEDARTIFLELGDYQDSKKMSVECHYEMGMVLYNEKQYDNALEIFDDEELSEENDHIDTIIECKYQIAMSYIADCDYKAAEKVLKKIRDYKDSDKFFQETSSINDLDVQDIITLGKFEQDNNLSNGPEDIEWVVLKKDGDSVYLLSRYALAGMPYNKTVDPKINWENSSIREWLNKDFYDVAFTDEEKLKIIPYINNEHENLANTTEDNVFLPNGTELENAGLIKYTSATEYAYRNGCWNKTMGNDSAGMGNCVWWLRSVGSAVCAFQRVIITGVYLPSGVETEGFRMDDGTLGVRPALWYDLSSVFHSDKKITEKSSSDKESTCTRYDNMVMAKDIDSANTGEYIVFGKYEQDNNIANGKEDIVWEVFDKKDNKLFVVSAYALTSKKFSENYSKTNATTWKESDLRKYLNKTFIDDAFSEYEKNKILTTKNIDSDTGELSNDKIFHLSHEEFWEYGSKLVEPTEYAYNQGVWNGSVSICWWLARDLDGEHYHGISPLGKIQMMDTDYQAVLGFGVVPAMWIEVGE